VAPLFITFEGLDGAGKTTQIKSVGWFLSRQKRRVRTLREPGGTPLGDHLRELLLRGDEITAKAEASLFAAARAQLVETVIKPSLAQGFDVLCDRHVDSSLAYQAYGRGLQYDAVAAWNAYIVGDLVPTRTYFLSLAAEDSSMRLARQLQLFGENQDPQRSLDRLEQESIVFRRRVQEGYERLAEMFGERILTVNAYLRPEQIRPIIRDDLRALLAREQQDPLLAG
jgi:dTMP kinase